MSTPLISRVGQAMQNTFGSNGTLYSTRVVLPSIANAETDAERFHALRAYRDNNRLYDALVDLLTKQGVNKEAVKGFRNPTNAAIEFHAATLWPGSLPHALPIEFPENAQSTDAKRAAIQQVWKWSNWGETKQLFAREYATLGEQWIKVPVKLDRDGTPKSVYMDLIEPEYVTEFDKDERGFLTYIRLDIPRTRRLDDRTEAYIHTEVWDKEALTYRVWRHKYEGRATDQLGTPDDDSEENYQQAYGIDFIPFVHAKFVDDGDPRGRAAIEPALDKIDEANRMATRLHQLMFQHGVPDKQLVSSLVDGDGYSQPTIQLAPTSANGTYNLAGETMWSPPAGTKIETILENIKFDAHLEAVNAMMDHLSRTDLPQLKWGEIADNRDLSGKAIRLMLTAAIAVAEEVRGNAESALVRAHQMALTIGQVNDLFDKSLGDYDKGDFEHWFEERSIVPLDEEEEAGVDKTKAETAVLRMTVGYPEDRNLEYLGMTEGEVKEYRALQPGSAATMEESGQAGDFNRGFTGGTA